jgi:glycosyltransferase involved in cell wall biosynthesis
MKPPLGVVFNGKFLSAEPTGVHRVALELIKAVLDRTSRDAALDARLRPQLWVPADGEAGARREGLPHTVIGPLVGIPWEQLTLPYLARGHLLVNLCNVGPMLASQAVTMMHDAQVRLTPASYGPGFRAWYRLHQPVAGRRHRRILTVSAYSREQLAHFGIAPLDHIGVVHNGVDHLPTHRVDDQILARLQLQPQRYVVALANTQAHKNIQVLFHAFADGALPGLKLVLFGAADRQAFAAKGITAPPDVCFAGRLSDAALNSLYRQALCMAFPSRTEGFGLPPLEAMAQGCPAVVAPCGALPEVCGDAACYAGPDDAAAWRTQIARLQSEPAWRAQCVAAGQQQASRFTWARAGEVLIQELLALVP